MTDAATSWALGPETSAPGQTHAFCVDGAAVAPCADVNSNDICDGDEDLTVTDVPGCTDASSCTFDADCQCQTTAVASTSTHWAIVVATVLAMPTETMSATTLRSQVACRPEAPATYNDNAATDDAGNCSYPPVNL